MEFDFTTILDRRGRDALAVDVVPYRDVTVEDGLRPIPMWVADMSFPAAPSVVEAIKARLGHPNFGYFLLPDVYYDAIIRWQRTRHGVEGLEKAHIGYENGVLGGVSAAIRALTNEGDPILVHSPTYIGFLHVLKDLGRRIVTSPLTRDEAGVWRMDYAGMARKIRENGVKLVIFCSPHNPCGRVWTREEIERAMDVYRDCGCTVLSDEIWADLTFPGHEHVPTQSVSEDARERTIAFYAPSKTFSLAGLIGSYHIVYNEALRKAVTDKGDETYYNSCNVLSLHALLGAYSERGARWVDELLTVLYGNLKYVKTFLESNFPGVSTFLPEGTYMLFVNCRAWCDAHGVTMDELLKRGVRAGVIWQNGADFGDPDCIRMNVALPFTLVKEAMQRLKTRVFI
ncbi:MAG: aminotransferase class I/II-fold pyridoxal phosphate-dependent enzyme [Clostridia bacterium]|nr:aminotransferase class I/II-fold pyridoxal phosphate-dependent enzyme [Clostridia bacterium]